MPAQPNATERLNPEPPSAAHTAIEIEGEAFNAGFVRQEAYLLIFVVSDDVDATADPTPAEFVDWLDTLKPDPDKTIFNATPDPINGLSYVDVAAQTGGESTDLHGPDWMVLFEDVLRSLEAEVTGMALPGPIDEDTLEAWWVPVDAKPERLGADNVIYDPDGPSLPVRGEERPDHELFVLYALHDLSTGHGSGTAPQPRTHGRQPPTRRP